MTVQHRCRTKRLALLPFIVLLGVFAATHAVAQSPADGEQQLTDTQKSELKEATESNNQVVKLFREGRYHDAAMIAERVLETRERVLGPKHPDTAQCLINLAVMYQYQSNHAAAEPLMIRGLKIYENVYGQDHLKTATGLNNLAGLYESQANYAAAEPLRLRSLKICKKLLGPEHPETATRLNNLGALYFLQAKYAEAEPLYQRSLRIREKVLGPEHPDTAVSLNNLSSLYKAQGDFAAAEPLRLRSLMIREKVLGPEHPAIATSLNNLATLYSSQGKHAAAEPLYLRALKIREKVLGSEHSDTAESLDNLATLRRAQGNGPAAERLHLRSLKIQEKVLGPNHPAIAQTLSNLAGLYRLQGRNAAAEPLYKRSLKIREKVFAQNHPGTAQSLNNLAVLYASEGNQAAAEPFYLRALKINENLFGPEHPSTAQIHGNLALLYLSQGKNGQAMSAVDKQRKGQRVHVSHVLPSLPPHSQELFLRANYDGSFHTALSLAISPTADADDVATSTEWLINGKGVAQDALAQRNLLSRDGDDPKLAPVVQELLSVRTRLAALAMSAAEAGKAEERQINLAALTADEQRLARQLGGGNSSATADWIELPEIREALPTDSVLIDVARFNVFNFSAKGQEPQWQASRYAAWITSPTEQADTVLVDLGDANAIDELVEKVRSQIAADAAKEGSIAKDGEESAAKSLNTNLAALAERIWQPLAQHVGDAKNIILSPDGALWLAPWSAIPVGESGDEYLLERFNLRMIVSGRDLVTEPGDRAARPPVILADPEFDQQESGKKSAIKGIFKTLQPEDDNATRSFSAKGTLPKVKPLPNTGIEAIAIQPHIETYTGKKVGLYKQQYALERVAKALHGPQIATFATHGFFLPRQETKLEDSNSLLADNSRPVVLDTEGKPIENPLLRCGLLLSGCNNRTATVGNDDGILTGMEIVGIDFRGTELVVLSACDTGVGDVRSGEGVAGLRQAFQLAGAEAVMATLWQIPDRESAILMASFFKHLADGQSKAEALRSAQIELIEKRRSRYGAAHPFYWAAFTLTGK